MEERSKKKRAILIAAGSFYGLPFSVSEEDLVIAVDGGMRYCKKEGIKPQFLLGDFDSYSQRQEGGCLVKSMRLPQDTALGEEKQYRIFGQRTVAKKEGKHVEGQSYSEIWLPEIKNDTDLHAAIKLALVEESREIHIFGALGGERMDHSYAALQSLVYLTERGGEGYLYGEKQVFTAIKNGKKSFSKDYHGYFSVFSFTDESLGVSERGCKYLIEREKLNNTEPVGISNEFIGEEAEIEVKNGVLILCYELLQA